MAQLGQRGNLPTSEAALNERIGQLSNDVEYLLKDKTAEVALDTQPCRMVLPEIVVRIVAGNLIRNASVRFCSWRIKQEVGATQLSHASPCDHSLQIFLGKGGQA